MSNEIVQLSVCDFLNSYNDSEATPKEFTYGDRQLTLESDFDEIHNLLKNATDTYGDYMNLSYELSEHNDFINSEWEYVDDDKGHAWSVVKSFTDPNNPENKFYIMFSGWYSSWGDSNLEELSVVYPYTFTETRFKREKDE